MHLPDQQKAYATSLTNQVKEGMTDSLLRAAQELASQDTHVQVPCSFEMSTH